MPSQIVATITRLLIHIFRAKEKIVVTQANKKVDILFPSRIFWITAPTCPSRKGYTTFEIKKKKKKKNN